MHDTHDVATVGDPSALAGVDLNLLVVLDALLRERNVTRAAARIGRTQSATSHALRRLRELFGDPLMVRGAGGMVLTPRADALEVPVRSALSTIGRALTGTETFEPATARRAFRLVSPDLFDALFLPAVLARVRATAPGVDLAVAPPGGRLVERLEAGELDLAVVPRLKASDARVPEGAGLRRRTLLHDRLRCFVRSEVGHGGWGIEDYAACDHVVVSPGDRGTSPVDRALAELGMVRRVALRVPSFATALAIAEQSDLVLTAPTALERLLRSDTRLVARPCPVEVPGHGIDLVWHTRFGSDAGHAWLREVLSSAVAASGANA